MGVKNIARRILATQNEANKIIEENLSEIIEQNEIKTIDFKAYLHNMIQGKNLLTTPLG